MPWQLQAAPGVVRFCIPQGFALNPKTGRRIEEVKDETQEPNT
jgi:hypothetical protein